jgi:hypothetical protein
VKSGKLLLLTAKKTRCHPPTAQNQRAHAEPPRALAYYTAMWPRIIQFDILIVAAGSILAVSVAHLF